MAQTTAPRSDTESDTDEESTDNLSDVLTDELAFVDELLESVDADDVADMSDEQLIEVRTHLKDLEDTAEEVRKEVADDELENRIEPGETLLGLSRIESHNKYLKEDVGTVIMRAVGQGIDYTDFVSVNASTLASEHPDLAEIGRAEYTYFR